MPGAVFAAVLLALGGVLPYAFTGDDSVVERTQAIWLLFALMQPLNGAVFALDGILIGAGDGPLLLGRWSPRSGFCGSRARRARAGLGDRRRLGGARRADPRPARADVLALLRTAVARDRLGLREPPPRPRCTARMRRAPILILAAVSALTWAGAAAAKEVHVTACGEDLRRTTTNALSGIATRAGPVAPPRSGRFYTIVLRLGPGAGHMAWTVAYEARRGIVRAASPDARAFLGRRWLRLSAEVRPPSPPPSAGSSRCAGPRASD